MSSLTLQDVFELARGGAPDGIDWDTVDTTSDELLAAIEAARELVNQDLALAISRSTLLTAIADSRDDALGRARARAVLAHALNYANRFDEARAQAAESARIAHDAGDGFAEGQARMAIVHACAREGAFAAGLLEAALARDLFQSAGNPAWVARAEVNAGVLHRMSGDPVQAAELFRTALEFDGHDQTAQAQIRNNLAEALLDTGKFEQAEREFRAACRLLTDAQAWRLGAMARGNLADLLGRQGRLAEALVEFETARRFFERDAAVAEHGRILIEQADVLGALGESDQAESAYRKAAELVSDAGLRAEHARALLGLGSMLIETRPDEADQTLERVEQICSELGNPAMQAQVRLMRAQGRLAAGDPATAREIAGGVEADFAPGRVERVRACAIVGRSLIAEARPADAIRRLDGAITETQSMPIARFELQHARAAAREASGDRDGALADLRACCATIEQTRGLLAFERHRAAITHQRRGAYDELVKLLVGSDVEHDLVEAFETAERARCRGWMEQLESGSMLPSEDSTHGRDAELLTDLQRRHHALNALYSRFDPASPAGSDSSLQAQISEQEIAIGELEGRLANSRAGSAFSFSPVSSDKIRGCLREDEGLIAFWMVKDELLAFVLRREGISVSRSEVTSEQLGELVSCALFQIRRGLTRSGMGPSDRRRAGADRALRSLGEAVWDPIEASGALNGLTRLTVVPTGPLHAAPFPAVIGPRGSLVITYEIGVLSSSELLPALRSRKETGTHPVLVGVPDRAAPAIEDEIAALAHAIPDAVRLESDAATWDALATASLRASLLHLACHGTHHPDAPLASALKLADRWVTARDVMGLELPGSTVVLSGCDTGRMDAAFGDEVHGLTRAFVTAGATALVTSLWPAHDHATRTLMEQIYAHAQPDGLDAAAVRTALTRAQRSQLEAGIHPALWAHLMFVGG